MKASFPVEQIACKVEPWWAIAYLAYQRNVPDHRGKRRVLSLLHRVGLRSGRPFLWRMRNGSYVAIAPSEGRAPWSVGWTCFEKGVWEPHIERLLRQQLRPGQKAMDIGANIGYFSAVMAQQTGVHGQVWSFEPVPSTYDQLRLCRHHNNLSQLITFPLALGAETCRMKMHYKTSMMGSASLHGHFDDEETRTVEVDVRRLDDLWREGQVGTPDLIKIDVEGHERDVFVGATELIATARPRIVMEYNQEAASAAGWTLAALASLLRGCANYEFCRVHDDALEPIDPANYHVAPGSYIDLFATVPS